MGKYKDNIIALFFFSCLVAIIICLNLNTDNIYEYSSNCAISKGYAFRLNREIKNSETFYIDNEAIALSANANGELRNEALIAFNIVNDYRVLNGLKPLAWNGNLENVASVRANEISQYFSHTRPNGKPWYTVNSKIQGGENLAYGFNNATDVVNAWMDSPSHKDNILYSDFKTIAISIYECNDIYYWSQEFGY